MVASFVHYCESCHPPSRNYHVVVVVVIPHDFDVLISYSHTTTTMIFYHTLYNIYKSEQGRKALYFGREIYAVSQCILLQCLDVVLPLRSSLITFPTDGGIQWIRAKPWMCSSGRCAPRRTTAASPWQSKLPAMCLHFLLPSIRCCPIP